MENIKSKFLVEMPQDFYDFWDFAKILNSKRPEGKYYDVDVMCAVVVVLHMPQNYGNVI